MTHVYRVVYGGVCEAWVEVDGTTITAVQSVTANQLVGESLDDLPTPTYVEAKLMAGDWSAACHGCETLPDLDQSAKTYIHENYHATPPT